MAQCHLGDGLKLRGTCGAWPAGATHVWDRRARSWRGCTATQCPHARPERLLNGSVALVNRAPYFGLGGFAGEAGGGILTIMGPDGRAS